MKKIGLNVIILGIVVVLAFLLWEKACDKGPSDDELARAKRLYSEYKAEVEAEEAEWQKERASLEAEIRGLKKDADEWEAVSDSKVEVILEKDEEIAKLKEEYAGLKDKDAKIANLLAQNIQLQARGDRAVEGWQAEKQANLRLRGIIDTKDIIIANLDRQLENKNALLKLSEELVATQDRKIKSLKLGKTLSQVLAAGGVSVALWQTFVN